MNMESKSSFVSVRDNLTSKPDRGHQFPVNYAYDYLYGKNKYLCRPDLKLNEHIRCQTFLKLSALEAGKDVGSGSDQRSDHGINLSPLAAGLPWATGFLACRQSKYWRQSMAAAFAVLQELAAETAAGDVSKPQSSVAEISQQALASNMDDGWARFPVYLFTDCDEERVKPLAVVNVFIFVFDDFWEMHEITAFSRVRELFVERMRPENNSTGGLRSSTQSMIDQNIARILELDQKCGNDSGRVMVEQLVRFFCRPPPPENFGSLEEFLLYRHEDVAAPYVLACVKFSINSPVDLDSPRLASYIRLFKDHFSVANDLVSWEKEKRAYDTGKVQYLVNTVDAVKRLFNLSTFDAAIFLTQALQFQVECDIDEELQRLIDENALTADEWQFVDATLHTLSGNVLVSTVISRYGGEACRLS